MAEQGLQKADYTWQKVVKRKKKTSKSTGAYATDGSPGPELPLVLQLTPEDRHHLKQIPETVSKQLASFSFRK